MTVEEVIADTLLHYVDPPGRTLWGRERSDHMAQSVLSALKAAGLVIVPDSIDEVTADEMDLPYVDVQLERPQRYENGVLGIKSRVELYRAMIRAATSPDAPGTADPVRSG